MNEEDDQQSPRGSSADEDRDSDRRSPADAQGRKDGNRGKHAGPERCPRQQARPAARVIPVRSSHKYRSDRTRPEQQ